MESIYDLMRRFYGKNYLPTYGKPEPRGYSKHQASKRGHQHKHRLSRGERNHLTFMAGGAS